MSGTIRKAEEEAILRARSTIRRAQRASARAKAKTNGIATAETQAIPEGADEDGDVDMGFANGIEDLDGPGDLDDESH